MCTLPVSVPLRKPEDMRGKKLKRGTFTLRDLCITRSGNHWRWLHSTRADGALGKTSNDATTVNISTTPIPYEYEYQPPPIYEPSIRITYSCFILPVHNTVLVLPGGLPGNLI